VVFSDSVTLPYEPFPGTIGVTPPEPGPHSIVPPRRWGGNMDITLRISLRRHLELPVPQGELARTEQSAYHVCTGVAADLMEATRAATRALIDHLSDVRGLDRQEAYALCSVAADLRIHEVVDAPNWMVGAFIPDDIFTA
jgi:acetamidase/formamidase